MHYHLAAIFPLLWGEGKGEGELFVRQAEQIALRIPHLTTLPSFRTFASWIIHPVS
jgi:hypothetical protein